jgi:hypothetical protein
LSLLGRHQEAAVTFGEVLRIDREFFERWPELRTYYERSSREAGRDRAPET